MIGLGRAAQAGAAAPIACAIKSTQIFASG